MRAVDPGRVALQHALDQAHRLEVLAPVEGRAQAQAGDHVGHRDLGRGLALVLARGSRPPRSICWRDEVLRRPPRARRRAAGRTRACAAGAARRRRCGGPRRRRRRRAVPAPSIRAHVGVGGAARASRASSISLGEPAQVLDERQLQHARPGPQLADGQRRHRLVAVHEARRAAGGRGGCRCGGSARPPWRRRARRRPARAAASLGSSR